jgi:hypothetical protein
MHHFPYHWAQKEILYIENSHSLYIPFCTGSGSARSLVISLGLKDHSQVRLEHSLCFNVFKNRFDDPANVFSLQISAEPPWKPCITVVLTLDGQRGTLETPWKPSDETLSLILSETSDTHITLDSFQLK